MGRWRLPALAAMTVLLSSCGDGPEIRQNLAQCRIDERDAERDTGDLILFNARLTTCMQAKGFIIEPTQENNLGYPCRLYQLPGMDAACYRRDSWLSGVVSSANLPRS